MIVAEYIDEGNSDVGVGDSIELKDEFSVERPIPALSAAKGSGGIRRRHRADVAEVLNRQIPIRVGEDTVGYGNCVVRIGEIITRIQSKYNIVEE